jgi:hypothetical protein
MLANMLHRRSWKEFKGVAARCIPDEARSSINPQGEITFDLATFRKMGEPQAMYLLYDESTRTIGLKPAHPDEPNAVLVRIRHARSNRVIRSQPFLHETASRSTARSDFPSLSSKKIYSSLTSAPR